MGGQRSRGEVGLEEGRTQGAAPRHPEEPEGPRQGSGETPRMPAGGHCSPPPGPPVGAPALPSPQFSSAALAALHLPCHQGGPRGPSLAHCAIPRPSGLGLPWDTSWTNTPIGIENMASALGPWPAAPPAALTGTEWHRGLPLSLQVPAAASSPGSLWNPPRCAPARRAPTWRHPSSSQTLTPPRICSDPYTDELLKMQIPGNHQHHWPCSMHAVQPRARTRS